MAESTLSVTFEELKRNVGTFLGFGPEADWTVEESQCVQDIIRRGKRTFLLPPRMPNETKVHCWSFLRPIVSLTAFGAPSGTLTTDPTGGTTITDTAGDFRPDDANTGAELVGRTLTITNSAGTAVTRTIASITSDTVLEVTSAILAGDAVASGDSYTISIDGCYNLPDDYGGKQGPMTFSTTTTFPAIEFTSEGQLRRLRQDSLLSQSGRPQMAAVRPRDTGGATGQRFEVCFWPTPDTTYTLEYRKIVNVDMLLDDTAEFPVGGMVHSETILAACMMVAESVLEPTPRIFRRKEEFLERVTASIDFDRTCTGQDFYGYNADRSDTRERFRSSRLDTVQVTFNGVLYP